MNDEGKCRRTIKDRAQERCERCGRGGYLTLHHRKKRSAGGKWDTRNCVMACGSGTTGCHGWIEANPDEAEKEGFHVRPWQDETVIPVWYRGEWKLLTADGRTEDVN